MKIFINDLAITIISANKLLPPNSIGLHVKLLAGFAEDLINKEIEADSSKSYFLLIEDGLSIKKAIKKDFKIIRAAGGLVKNEDSEILAIKRYGKWDIPKGKIDKHEKMKIAALREVREECGIKDLILKERIVSTYHIFMQRQKLILKQTNWYNMTAPKAQNFEPQESEGISKVEWKSADFFTSRSANTYKSIKELIPFMMG